MTEFLFARGLGRGLAASLVAWWVVATPLDDARAQVAPTESSSAVTATLPSGPGSVAGLAEPAELDLFSAQVDYSVPIRVPTAGGLSPSVSLTYSGALGNSSVGVGWNLAAPAIRRSSRHGVPHYDDTDELTIEGLASGRLVRTGPVDYAVEGGGCTMRVRRAGESFEVTDGNGTRWVFGHTAQARQHEGRRVAAWFLEYAANLSGEVMYFQYRTDRGQTYLSRIEWGPARRYRLEVVLQPRVDTVTSFATGFEVTTALRVDRIRSLVSLPGPSARTEIELAGYELRYDDEDADAENGSLSRLVGVTMTGRRTSSGQPVDAAALPPLTFGYASPHRPKQWNLETEGWVLDRRGVALVDVDGDGADDLLRLEPGYTAWRKNLGGSFGPQQPFAGAAALELDDVRFLDLDGDARTEVVRIVDDTWRAYRIEQTDGQFGLSASRTIEGSRGVGLGRRASVLVDVDGDGRVDVLDGVTGGLRLRKATRTGLGPAIYLPPIGGSSASIVPGAPNTRFLDVNGDSLADAVWMTDAWMNVYLGRGDGTFMAFAKVFYPWRGAVIDVAQTHLVDLDRDGVLDLLRVDAGWVRWFRGLAGFRFATLARQMARPDGAELDVRVTFADVDGNGSEEVVWANPGAMWALDFAGGTTRAMLASIDDGMGEVTEISYSSTAELSLAARAAGMPWEHELPRSMAVPVRQRTSYADGTPSRVVDLGLRDGFWDGAERRFGGFLVGRTVLPGDTARQVRVESTTFHRGAGGDRVLRGKPVEVQTTDGLGTPYLTTASLWLAYRPACLDGATNPNDPLLRRAVRVQQDVANHEGVTEPIVTRVETHHDSEGRPVEERHLGRLDLEGDEIIRHKVYASDPATWVRDRLITESVSRGDGVMLAQTRHYFGNHFGEPLAHGQIGYGWPRKSERLLWQDGSRPTSARWVTHATKTYDARGNVRTSTEGSGDSAVSRTFEYDADGLFAVRESIEPVPGRVQSWVAVWDQVLGVPTAVTEPSGDTAYAEYDGLGRIIASRKNDLPAHQHFVYSWTAPRPTTYTYVFDGDVARLPALAKHWQRTDGYWHWRHSASVADSAGDELYKAGRLDANRWLIDGWKRKDGRGRVTEVLDGFTHGEATLPSAPPAGISLRRQLLRYDVMDRVFDHELASGSHTRTTYRAFERTVFADGLAPVTSYLDGQGRIRRTERVLATDDDSATEVESVDATYDADGRILSFELQRPSDAERAAPCGPGSPWVSHCFSYDSLGRLVEADDPDIGLRQMTYDDAGRLVRHVNGAGQGISLTYDRGGRLTSRRADDGTAFEYFYDVAADGRTPVPARLAWIREPLGRVEFEYDVFGRGRRVVREIGGADGLRLSHDTPYAPSGASLGHGYTPDWTQVYSYDMAGRTTQVIGRRGEASDVLWEATSYDDAGRLTGERFGNGVVAAYEHDSNGQNSRIIVRRAATGSSLYDVGLTRNAYGAVTTAADGDRSGLDHSATFSYDVAGRLVAATLGTAPAQGAPDTRYGFTYGYDGLQNMVSRQVAQAPRALGQYLGKHCYGGGGAGPRQLTSVVAGGPGTSCDAGGQVLATFSYDDAGRQLTDATSRMTYDGLDQLVAVDLASGARVEYGYGYDGLRIRSADNQGGAPEHWFSPELREQGGVLEQYIKVGDRVVAKVRLANVAATEARIASRAQGRVVGRAVVGGLAIVLVGVGILGVSRRRSWRPGMATMLMIGLLTPGCGALFGTSEGPLWRPVRVTYLHTGFAAGPVLVTSENATIVDERRYEPFGQAIDSFREPAGLLDTIDFALEPLNVLNKPSDPRTGWSYHGARWVAPQTARWLTPDPPVKAPDATFMDTPWKLHPYQYVEQNPIIYWDADGRDSLLQDIRQVVCKVGRVVTTPVTMPGIGSDGSEPPPPEYPAHTLTSLGHPAGPYVEGDGPLRFEVGPQGNSDYYRLRYADFVRRNPGQQPPDYYLQYGDKYLRAFTSLANWSLSKAGQAWMGRTRANLQNAMETYIRRDPKGFANLERDPDAFRSFAFGTHQRAYVDAGLVNVPWGDRLSIGVTPDCNDLLTVDGVSQAVTTGLEVLWLDIKGVF